MKALGLALVAALSFQAHADTPYLAPWVVVATGDTQPALAPAESTKPSPNRPGLLLDVKHEELGTPAVEEAARSLVARTHAAGWRAGIMVALHDEPEPATGPAMLAATAESLFPGLGKLLSAAKGADLFLLSFPDLKNDPRPYRWVIRKVASEIRAANPGSRIGLLLAGSNTAPYFPEATGEAQFRAVAESQQVALPGAGAAEQLVQRLAQYLVPGRPPPASAQEIEGFLVRAMAAMETFATAYVSLRRSQEEFGAEMAGFTKRNADPDPIENPQDPKALLAHLLDWTGDGDARMRSLRRQYAEIMSHQVALLGGLMEGVRKLVQVRLSPKAILEHVERAGGLGFGPFKGAAAWKRYLALHDELTEDKEITSAIFGRDFARAYSAGLGENFGGDDPRRVASGRGH